ncbi:2-(3-amino-3-carboxypropyl)histidine synthase subunit 2 [Neodiprion virginianus]|uniref:2-(3-amino-3-carboxypropyl)histidine synthase subunit 2 n=1 Tax=Neodiprion virginianus TaxID=2961670 RepID=UPI001EE718CE|nr:2-(3-amino-3-carboxypropyl)histidine synthase subunit 2 [Neodiprion virginianus]
MPAADFSSNEQAVFERVAEVDGLPTKTLPENLDSQYDLDMCVEWINNNSLGKVCLQFPDSLLPDSVEIALRLEKRLNKNVYILGDSSYGSCCVDEVTAQHVNADGIVHFGHACLNPTSRLPVFHILPKQQLDIRLFVAEFKQHFEMEEERILFFYDVSYAHLAECIYNTLRSTYKNFTLTKLNCSSNTRYTDSGDVDSEIFLGRSYKLDAGYNINDYKAIFLGPNGKTLNNLALGMAVESWYHFDGSKIAHFTASDSIWLKRRRYLVEKLKDARVVGIVVATLGIKNYLESIAAVKNVLKRKNKKSYIVCVGKPNPAKLANFPEIDAFVVIACPENLVYDSRDFFKPMLTPFEVEIAFNTSRAFSTQYCMDFRHILSTGLNYVPLETSSDSDVSLISGSIRNLTNDESPVNGMGKLVSKSAGTVAIGKGGADYLLNRSWQGLEQKLGQDSVKIAAKGRIGLPMAYENEPLKKET